MADKNLKIAMLLSAKDMASGVINKTFGNAERQAKILQNAGSKSQMLQQFGSKMNEAGNVLAIAGAASTAFFTKTIYDAREAEIAQKKLITGFETMGSTAAQAKSMADFAGKLQFEIGVGDEDIEDVMGKLSTFKRAMTDQAIASGVFTRATQAAFDMQAKGFGDAMGNITQIGKALQNPALGAQALSKAGAINKEDMPMLKKIQMEKGIPAAQMFLLDALEKQVKGTAKNMADPIKVMELQAGEASETIGRALLPTVQALAASISNIIPTIANFIEKHQEIVLFAARAGAALLLVGSALKIVGAVATSVGKIMEMNPVILIIAGIAFAAMLIYTYWEPIKAFFISLWESIKNIFSATWNWIKNMFLTYTPAGLVIKHWNKIATFFSGIWNRTKVVFSTSWNWIKNMFLNYTPQGLIIKHWDKIKAWFTTLWEDVKAIFMGWVDWTMNLGAKFVEAGKNIALSIWQGIKAMAHRPIEAIAEITSKIGEYIPFYNAKTSAVITGNQSRMSQSVARNLTPSPAINNWNNSAKQLNQPIPAYANNSYAAPMSTTIHLHGGATEKDATIVSNQMKQELDKWWKSKQHNESRVKFG